MVFDTGMNTSKSAQLPPAQPTYILRGHTSQIHALCFTSQNRRLLSGDGDGFVISWDTATKRPVAGWRAHDRAILGVCAWPSAAAPGRRHFQPSKDSSTEARPLSDNNYDENGNAGTSSRIITQGRDGTIRLWRLDTADEKPTGTYVAPEQLLSGLDAKKPAMLLEVAVGAVSFCGFAVCAAPADMAFAGLSSASGSKASTENTAGNRASGDNGYSYELGALLLAAPHAGTSEDIDIFYLPAGTRKSTITSPRDGTPRLGMLMSVLVSAGDGDGDGDGSTMPLTVGAGYENGAVLVYRHDTAADRWTAVYRARPHSQPVLSLCLHPARKACFSSAADDVIAKHPFDGESGRPTASATATGAQEGVENVEEVPRVDDDGTTHAFMNETPLKVARTKHAGQQGLAVRSDGRILAAAGWDARVRVYSTKTLRELAVLKVHRQGCYAAAFAEVGGEDGENEKHSGEYKGGEAEIEARPDTSVNSPVDAENGGELTGPGGAPTAPVGRLKKSLAMARYEQKIQSTHWLAAGSKDGTISLWDVF